MQGYWRDWNDAKVRTVRVWRYNAATNAWAVVRTLPPLSADYVTDDGGYRRALPVPWKIVARTAREAYIGYYHSGRIDWYHPNPAGSMVWEQVRWGTPLDREVHLAAVPGAPGRALANVFGYEVSNGSATWAPRIYRRTTQGAWVKQVRILSLNPTAQSGCTCAGWCLCGCGVPQPGQPKLCPASCSHWRLLLPHYTKFGTKGVSIDHTTASGAFYSAALVHSTYGAWPSKSTYSLLESIDGGAFRNVTAVNIPGSVDGQAVYHTILSTAAGGRAVAAAIVGSGDITDRTVRLVSYVHTPGGRWAALPVVNILVNIPSWFDVYISFTGLVLLHSGSAVVATHSSAGVLVLEL